MVLVVGFWIFEIRFYYIGQTGFELSPLPISASQDVGLHVYANTFSWQFYNKVVCMVVVSKLKRHGKANIFFLFNFFLFFKFLFISRQSFIV